MERAKWVLAPYKLEHNQEWVYEFYLYLRVDFKKLNLVIEVL